MKDSKNLVIGLLCTILCVMAVAYASFSTQLSINGTAAIDSNWDISIQSVDCVETAGGSIAVEDIEPQITGSTTVTLNVRFNQPGDKAVCTVKVANNGTLDGILTAITPETISNDTTNADLSKRDAIHYTLDSGSNGVNTTIAKAATVEEVLTPGLHTFVITAEYKDIKDANNQSVELTEDQKSRNMTFNFNYQQSGVYQAN